MSYAIDPLGYLLSFSQFEESEDVEEIDENSVRFATYNSVSGLSDGSYTFGVSPLDDFGPYDELPTTRFQVNSDSTYHIENESETGFDLVLDTGDPLSVTLIVT